MDGIDSGFNSKNRTSNISAKDAWPRTIGMVLNAADFLEALNNPVRIA